MSQIKKKIGLLVGLVWYWFSLLFFSPLLIWYLFDSPNLLSELVVELITVGAPTLILASFHRRVDDTKVALYEIDDRPIKGLPLGVSFGSIAVCIGLFFFVTYAVNTFQLIYGLQTGEFVVTSVPEMFSFGAKLAIIFVNALLPAVFEEIAYRGLFFDAFRQNNKSAIWLVPTLVFASLHSGAISVISAFLLGLILIALYSKFRSLKLVIIMHFIYNTLGEVFGNFTTLPFSVLSIWLQHPNNTQLLIAIMVSVCITLLALLITLYLFVHLLQKKLPCLENDKVMAPTKQAGDIVLVVCLIIFAFLTFALKFSMDAYEGQNNSLIGGVRFASKMIDT